MSTRNEPRAARQAFHDEPPDELVAALTRMDQRIDRKKKRRRFAPIGSARSRQRLREIERFLSWQWGSILPDDDAGRDDLHVLLSVCKAVGHGWEAAKGFIGKWAPWMSEADTKRAYTDASLSTAYLDADMMAKRLGVTWAVRQSLRLRTIGAIDKPKAEREQMRRAKADAKRKAKPAEPTPLKPREAAIMKMVGPALRMSDLARKAKRHRLFQKLDNVPHEVRRVVKRLVAAGHLGQRLEPSQRGGTEWFLWRKETKEMPAAQAYLKNAPRQNPIFIDSNRGADSYVNIAKLHQETDLDSDLNLEAAVVASRERAAAGARRFGTSG